MRFLNQVRLWQKLALLVVAMAVPTALLGGFYLSGANTQVSLARDELDGARYVESVGAVLAEASNHRSRLFALLTGDSARRDEVSSSEAETDKLVAEVDASDAKVGTEFRASASWLAIKSDWERLKAEGPKLTAEDAVARHNVLIDHIFRLSETIAARSGLNLDPSPETAVVIQIATRTVPSALIATSNIRWYATRASIKGYLGGDDRMALQVYYDESVAHFDSVERDLERASAQAKARVRPSVDSARSAFTTAYDVVKEKIVATKKLEITSSDLYASTRQITSSLQQLSDVSYGAMNAAVQQRLS